MATKFILVKKGLKDQGTYFQIFGVKLCTRGIGNRVCVPGGWFTGGTESACPAGGSLEEGDMETAKAQTKGVRL